MTDAIERITRFRTETLPVFADCPGHAVATEFLDWLEREMPETVGVDDVEEALGREIPFDIQLWTITILTSARHHVFDSEMHYLSDDGSFQILPKGSASLLMAGRAIADPVTGRPVEDAASRTIPRFRLRDPSPEPAGPTP